MLSLKVNGHGDPFWENCRLVDTMYRHRWKQYDFHRSWWGRIEIFLLQTCFSLLIFLAKRVRESAYLRVLWKSITICILIRPWLASHQKCIPLSSFSLKIFSLDGTFVPSSKWKHDFSCIFEIVFQKPFLKTDLKSTNATHSIHILKVFYF